MRFLVLLFLTAIWSLTSGASPISLSRPLVAEVDDSSQDLTLLDLDADSRLDILATNNADGAIDFFYRLASDEIAARPIAEPLPYDRQSLITSRVVDDLAAGDLDTNGLPDVVVGSERGGAAVFFQTEPRTFETARRLPAPGRFVLVTDWDRDGTAEILALATTADPNTLTLLEATAERDLKALWTVALTGDVGETPRLVDWDLDGFPDLLWATTGITQAHLLANDGKGGVGGETIVEIGQTIDWAPFPLADRTALVAIDRASGLLRLLAPAAPEASDSPLAFGGALQVALPEADSADRVALVTGRLGTEEADAIYLPHRNSAESMIVTANPARQLHRQTTPGLREAASVQMLPVSGVGTRHAVSLLLVSRAEGTVAITNPPLLGASPPQPLPVGLQPLAAVAGNFQGPDDSGQMTGAVGVEVSSLDLLVLGRTVSGESNSPPATLLLSNFHASSSTPHISPLTSRPLLPNLPTDDPTSISVADLNGDGSDDLFIFYQYRAPLVYLQQSDHTFRPLTDSHQVPATFFEGVGPNALWVGDLTADLQPEVLLARGGLLRLLGFTHPPQVEVLGQLNAPRPNTEFVAVAALAAYESTGVREYEDTSIPPGSDARTLARSYARTPLIFALDRTSSTVFIAEPLEGGWQFSSEIDLPLAAPQRLALGDWDGDARPDLAVKGANALALLFGGLTRPPLEQIASLESPLDDGRFARVETLAWDDNTPWVHTIDHRWHTLLMYAWGAGSGEFIDPDPDLESWAPVYRFKVYESPYEMRLDADAPVDIGDVQPREMAVGDLDGDGRDDLVLLAHEHLLMYLSIGFLSIS